MSAVVNFPTREIGHAMAVSGPGTQEDNWALRFPHSARVFAKMAREDAQVTSILSAVTLPIRRATWQLDPNGAPDEIVSHVSQDLRLPVRGEDQSKPTAPRRGRVSWNEHLHKALMALQFGVMFFEQVYEPGPDGREHLVKLAPRYPASIDRINVARDGGLESIEQRAMTIGSESTGATKIPVDRLVAYVYEPQDSSWTGSSVLRPAYKHWKLRDQFLRLEAQVLERNGMGVPTYTGSEFAQNPEDDLEYGQKVASDLRSGQSAGAAIPAGAKLDIKGVNGQLTSPREAIAYHDSMMAKTVLAHFLNLEGKGGSYALAETQSDLFIQSLQTIAEWIADTATQHVIEDIVQMGFPGYDGLCPQVVFDPIASKKELSAQDLATLVRDGVIHMDKDTEEHVRRSFSQPPKRPLSEAIKDGSVPPPGQRGKNATPDDLQKLTDSLKKLVDSGVEPSEALKLVGLPPDTALSTQPPSEVKP